MTTTSTRHILTAGFSFEGARAYIRSTGADVVCVGFLKTMKHGYNALPPVKLKNGPYQPHRFGKPPSDRIKTYNYHDYIVDQDAPRELSEKLDSYRDWDWTN